MNNKILIIGGDHHNTLGLIESLALKGIKSYAIIVSHTSSSYVLKSKFLIEGWLCHTDSNVLECMFQHFSDTNEKTIVIASNDNAASLLDNNSDVLEQYFILPNSRFKGQLTSMMSKQYMSNLACKVGLTIPETVLVVNNELNDNVDFPCITKAISSVDGDKDNIKICQNIEELKDFLNNQKHCLVIQIQKFIDKQFEFQFLGCSLDSGNEVIIPGRTQIDRPNGIDNTFFLKFSKYEENLNPVVDKVKEFIKETGYSGLFSVEFLRGKDGKNYFMEMNFRNDGNAYCVTDSGMNLPYIWYAYNAGLDYKEEVIKDIHDSYIMPELYYTKRAFAGEVAWREWRKNLKKTTCYTTYFKQDKKPFIYFLNISLIHFYNIILRKLRLKK